jgi:deazaflavin-dependent oxidoreductase (nitroreductase family)
VNDFNKQVIEEFRANKGVVGGHFEGKQLVILHTVGRRSGEERLNPLLAMPNGEGVVLLGSNGGAEKEPAWVANLEAAGEATIELGERTLKVRPTVLREGEEWQSLYDRYVDYWPGIRSYEQNTDRKFAMIRLDPVA